jgi:hypothetical protein
MAKRVIKEEKPAEKDDYKKDIEEIKALLAQMNENLNKLLKVLPFGK